MDDGTHGRIRVLQRPEGDGLGVTLWGTEYVSSPDEWRELAARILAACSGQVAKASLTSDDLHVGMVCRMSPGLVVRINEIKKVGEFSVVSWTSIGPSGHGGKTGYTDGSVFVGGIAEVLSHG